MGWGDNKFLLLVDGLDGFKCVVVVGNECIGRVFGDVWCLWILWL